MVLLNAPYALRNHHSQIFFLSLALRMKKMLLLLLTLPLTAFTQTNYKKKANVLFLGNSYTYVNNLPSLIYNVARANGDTLAYDANTIGGYSFNNHFNNALSISKIKAQPWDYVILQAQSQEPSFSDQQVINQTYPYAIKLDSVIKENSNCTHTVFYETWGRKQGDQLNCPNYPPVCTYLGMQARLKKWYKTFADSTDGIMAPVGEGFRASIAANPTLELYDPDQSHPSMAGSYLAACIFYEILFQRSVLSNTYNPGLAVNTLTFLQQTAHDVMRDSLAVWNMGINHPWADFTFTTPAPGSYQFQSASPLLSNKWYFGDGTTSLQAGPVHVYGPSGTYSISHVVTLGCRKDSVVKVITYTNVSTGLEQVSETGNKEPGIRLFPSPCKDVLYLEGGAEFEKNNSQVLISDLSGRVISSGVFVNPLPVSGLSNGAYFIRISNNFTTFNARFLKNE